MKNLTAKPRNKQKSASRRIFVYLSSPSERHSFFSMTVATQKLIKSAWVWLKWELFYFSSTFWTFPIPLIHLSLKTAIILLICHFAINRFCDDIFSAAKSRRGFATKFIFVATTSVFRPFDQSENGIIYKIWFLYTKPILTRIWLLPL